VLDGAVAEAGLVSSALSTLPRRPWACGQGEAGRAPARAAGEWGRHAELGWATALVGGRFRGSGVRGRGHDPCMILASDSTNSSNRMGQGWHCS
jgi:hypothetical protein